MLLAQCILAMALLLCPRQIRTLHRCNCTSASAAGAPAYNATYFCDDGPQVKCYTVRTSLSWFDGNITCNNLNGVMAQYMSYEEQVGQRGSWLGRVAS